MPSRTVRNSNSCLTTVSSYGRHTYGGSGTGHRSHNSDGNGMNRCKSSSWPVAIEILHPCVQRFLLLVLSAPASTGTDDYEDDDLNSLFRSASLWRWFP